MDEARAHPCVIVGLGHGARADYVIRHVRIGDGVDLNLEPNRYDPLTVAAYHQGQPVGCVAPGWRWLARSLERGKRHAATVTGFEHDAGGDLSAIVIAIFDAAAERNPEADRPASPAPGSAPWAPRIVHAPLPRWPVVIPLVLLAGIAAGAWLLLERGFLPQLGRFAGGL
jgi:hypothetical protein